LKHWLAANFVQTPLDAVNSPEHQAIADQIAERSVTLVKNRQSLIPIQIDSEKRIAVIVPKPQDLTPADTSSYLTPRLAKAVREIHPNTLELIIPISPSENDIEGVMVQLAGVDLVIAGTINAAFQPGQAAMVKKILSTGKPTITVALRLPYDLASYPEASTYLCTYSILDPSMQALVQVLFGWSKPLGSLPVSIPGVAKAGSGM
jgi:beta-N-acetylhexosaminidase